MKPKLFLELLCLLILFSFTGCQQSSGIAGLPDSTEIASLETLYGQEKEAALEVLGLQEHVSQEEVRGMLPLQNTRSIAGTAFSQFLLLDNASGTVYGVRYLFLSDDANGLTALAQSLTDDASQKYGEPSTYPELPSRLTAETFPDGFAAAMENGSMNDWREEWTAGETTRCTITVSVSAPDAASLTVEYALIAER